MPEEDRTKPISMNTILLIESNVSILENFTEYLELEGFHIFGAKTGIHGIEIAREFLPDLIISEIVLQETDGYAVLQLLLATPQTFGIPFIFCTTKSEKKDKQQAMQLGADDFIVKPNSMDLMCTMARHWIKSGSKRVA